MDRPAKPTIPDEPKRTLDEIIEDAVERSAAERDKSGKDKEQKPERT